MNAGNFSRRQMLKFAAVTGAAAMFVKPASAQAPTRKIDSKDSALDAIISTSEPIRILGEGYGGDGGPAEGPVWWKEGGYLLFSDIGNNRRMKYTPGQGISLFKQGTEHANGLTRDLQGRLVACEGDTQRVVRIDADGAVTVIPKPSLETLVWRAFSSYALSRC